MMLGAFYTKDVTRFLPGILDQLVREKMVVRDIEVGVETADFFGTKTDIAMYSLPRE